MSNLCFSQEGTARWATRCRAEWEKWFPGQVHRPWSTTRTSSTKRWSIRLLESAWLSVTEKVITRTWIRWPTPATTNNNTTNSTSNTSIIIISNTNSSNTSSSSSNTTIISIISCIIRNPRPISIRSRRTTTSRNSSSSSRTAAAWSKHSHMDEVNTREMMMIIINAFYFVCAAVVCLCVCRQTEMDARLDFFGDLSNLAVSKRRASTSWLSCG